MAITDEEALWMRGALAAYDTRRDLENRAWRRKHLCGRYFPLQIKDHLHGGKTVLAVEIVDGRLVWSDGDGPFPDKEQKVAAIQWALDVCKTDKDPKVAVVTQAVINELLLWEDEEAGVAGPKESDADLLVMTATPSARAGNVYVAFKAAGFALVGGSVGIGHLDRLLSLRRLRVVRGDG